MNEIFTPRMLRIIERARAIADEHACSKIGTEHLVLAVLEDRDAVATQALRQVVDPARVHDRLSTIMASDGYRGVARDRPRGPQPHQPPRHPRREN